MDDIRKLLESTLTMLKHCEVSSGVCHCGDSMDAHALAWNAGHVALDTGASFASNLKRDIEKFLEG